MRKRFLGMEDNIIIAAATLLDPRFKKLAFTDQGAAEQATTKIVNDAIISISSRSTTQCAQNSPTSNSTQCAQNSPTSNSDSNPVWQYFDHRVSEASSSQCHTTTALTEMQQFLKTTNLNRHDDAIQWWRENAHIYPTLSKLARRYFCPLATSVPSERLFSKAGELVSARRSSLKPKHIDMYLFLNKYE